MCVCWGGITHPFLLSTDRQEKIMWPCEPCQLMPGQERSIHHHQDIGVGRCFDLGGGGGGKILYRLRNISLIVC